MTAVAVEYGHTTFVPVHFDDLDALGVLHNARYAVFVERATCAVCGEPCKREALAGSAPFAYAGDGVSDRCVSLAADRIFARDGLARWLDSQGVPYELFDDLDDVRVALRSGG